MKDRGQKIEEYVDADGHFYIFVNNDIVVSRKNGQWGAKPGWWLRGINSAGDVELLYKNKPTGWAITTDDTLADAAERREAPTRRKVKVEPNLIAMGMRYWLTMR